MTAHDVHQAALDVLSTRSAASLNSDTSWSFGGALDSPLPQGRIAEVRRRSHMPLGVLLARAPRSGVVLIADSGSYEDDMAAAIVALFLAQHQEVGTPPPLWIRGWAVNLDSLPERALNDYVATRGRPEEPLCIILERPDLHVRRDHTIDGMRLRGVLARWSAAFPTSLMIVLLGATSFAFQDPLPGWLVLKPGPQERPSAFAIDLPNDFHPRASAAPALVDGAREAARGKIEGFSALYRLLAQELPGRPIEDLFLDTQTLATFEAPRLTKWLHALMLDDERDCRALASIRRPRSDALVATRLYLSLYLLEPHFHRTTFRGQDPGRWFCYLRGFGHEMLAVVAQHLSREDLAGVNLMHAPPLACSRLVGADLSEADLYRVNLAQSDLGAACFARADLSRSHLKGADLRHADLSGADLSYASLELADLRGTRLTDAKLYRAITDHAQEDS